MSNARAKAERSQAKDVRQGIEAQREREQRMRKRLCKPWHLMHRWPRWMRPIADDRWHCYGKYATREDAERQLAKKLRGYAGLAATDGWRIDGPAERAQKGTG